MVVTSEMRRTLVLLFGLVAVGCTIRTPSSVARARAANDFQCPEEQIIVEQKAGSAVAAAGCGKTASYNCDMQQGGITCVAPGEPPPGQAVPLPPAGATSVPQPAPAVIKSN